MLGLGLERKVGKDFFPKGFLGDHLDLADELLVFCRDDTDHIFDEPMVKHAGHIAASHDPVKGKKKDLGILRDLECHRGTTVVPTSEGLPEELIFPHTDQKCLVAPEILLYHIDGS